MLFRSALDLVAAELSRVRAEHGNDAIFAGSYGWASAGRFHHALSQLHRFMNTIGGYTYSVNTYSLAAAEVIVPHVVGHSYNWVQREATSLPLVAEHTRLLVTFGGIPLKNAQIQSGGQGRHAMESPTDPKRHEKEQIAREIAGMLSEAHKKHVFDRLILIAPPAMLGDLRDALPKDVANALHGELPKDLTQMDERSLEDHVGTMLAV